MVGEVGGIFVGEVDVFFVVGGDTGGVEGSDEGAHIVVGRSPRSGRNQLIASAGRSATGVRSGGRSLASSRRAKAVRAFW